MSRFYSLDEIACKMVRIGEAKADLSISRMLLLGILAVASKDITGKILGIYFPIMAFVASGFEHSIANMYFIPVGLLLKGKANVIAVAGLDGKLNNLTLHGFFVNNLIPVTLLISSNV